MNTNKSSRYRRSVRAFTLIELLIVIAIIAILAAILFPVFARARENARRSACQSNLKQIGIGILQYVQDFDERMPLCKFDYAGNNQIVGGKIVNSTNWDAVIYPYVKSLQVYECPSVTRRFTIGYSVAGVYDAPVTPDGVIKQSYVAFTTTNGFLHPVTSARIPSVLSYGPYSWNAFNQGVLVSQLVTPSEAIAIGELTRPQFSGVASVSLCTASFDSSTLPAADLTNHLTTSNFLFADGHVKAMRWDQTYTATRNLWAADSSALDPACYFTGTTATTKLDGAMPGMQAKLQ